MPRTHSSREDIGNIWKSCGLDNEWSTLKSVLLHRPGPELGAIQGDPTSSLMLGELDADAIRFQHDLLAQAFRDQGVEVFYVPPPSLPPPNQMFTADLFAMTPEGAILGRPASAVRAGEERWVARALADAGIPILHSVRGEGTFEGADLMWLAPDTALMGQLRIVDRDLAIVWKDRLPGDAVQALESRGFRVVFLPDETEAKRGFAMNFVVLGPRTVLIPTGNPVTENFLAELGITCFSVDVGHIGKAAGSIGCLTGVVEREGS